MTGLPYPETLIMSDLAKPVLMTLLLGMLVDGDWTICQPGCKCKWVSGRKTADCIRASLRSVPETLSSEIQSLDLSENLLDSLPREAFRSVGLENLHKIYLRACGIKELHRDAFKGLGILVEIDLSDNHIIVLSPGTFKDNTRLRLLTVNKNRIKKIESNLLNNLFYLQNVEFADCKVSEIEDHAFQNVTNLLHLKLNGNQLVGFQAPTLMELSKLKSLVLHDNPWQCNCHLRDFRNWVIKRNLYSTPTSCAEPEHLRNKMWNSIRPNEFACKPEILWPSRGTTVVADRSEVTLGCKVAGNPMPHVRWVHNSRIISEDDTVKYNPNKYSIKSLVINETDPTEGWVNMTVRQVSSGDKGQVRCVAESPGGSDKRAVGLVVAESRGLGSLGGGESWPLVVGLTSGLMTLGIITSVLCCFLSSRQKTNPVKSSTNNPPSNGDRLSQKSQPVEQEKKLLNINTLQKPVGSCELQITPNNDPFEPAEVNRKLLDENSDLGIAWSFEEEPSVEYLETRREQDIENTPPSGPHPPDLLSFPPITLSSSPVNSSNKINFKDSPRVSFYEDTSVGYKVGSLPRPRSSHPPESVPVPSRGYATLARVQRVPAAPPPLSNHAPSASLAKPEPAYDNLGPRTSADGSSVLFLNKSSQHSGVRNNPSATKYVSYGTRQRGVLSFCPSEIEDGDFPTCNNDVYFRQKPAPIPPRILKRESPLSQGERGNGTQV